MALLRCVTAILILCLATAQQHLLLQPPEDAVVPFNSTDNVTYSCSRIQSSNAPLAWELNNDLQIWSELQRQEYADSGVLMEEAEDGLRLTVTPLGRGNYNPLAVKCLTYTDQIGRIGVGVYSSAVSIITFDVPGPVEDLKLVYHNQSHLLLQWNKQKDNHSITIPVYYTVTQDSATTGAREMMMRTNETKILIEQTNDCEQHNFGVVANNDAGTSPISLITERIPISPSVKEIEESQKFTGVTLTGRRGVNISISYEEAKPCNQDHPVLNYTIVVEGIGDIMKSASKRGLITEHVTDQDLSSLQQDKEYRVYIRACTQFFCKTTGDPLFVYTSHIIEATVNVYETSVYANCTPARGSNATCVVQFTAFSDQGTENITATSSESADCPKLNQTRGAYTDQVLVYANVSGLLLPQPISATVTEVDDKDALECNVPTDDESGGLRSGDIGGISVGTVGFVALLVTISIVIIGLIWYKRRDKGGSDSTDNGERYRKIGWLRLKEGKLNYENNNNNDDCINDCKEYFNEECNKLEVFIKN